jgi:adenylate kinase family enzyme
MADDLSIPREHAARPCTLLILLGPPGAGKGTQCSRLAQMLGMPHVSTGDILRDHVRQQTESGKHLKAVMDGGALVPDALVLDMLAERIATPDCSQGFILDGFPRTRGQAESLDQLLSSWSTRANLLVARLKVSARPCWRGWPLGKSARLAEQCTTRR